MKYRIYEEFYEDVEKKLNRIRKKCEKNGNPFIFEIVGEEIKEVEDEVTKRKTYYKFIVVEVEGTAKINNYECVAVLENHKEGNVIRRINNDIDIPERFRYTDNFCEHCKSKRRRNELYIIHNTETDEFKQVGSNCLMLYTNGLNAEYVAGYIDGITELEEFDGFIGGGGKYYISVDDVLSYATEIINKMGYFNTNSNCPTKYLVSDMLNTYYTFDDKLYHINKKLKNNNFVIDFNKDDFYKDSTEKTVDNIINYYLSLDNDSEFINNVQVILKDRFVEHHNIGFLCYLPEGYFKYIKKEIEKAEQRKINEESKHFGEIGKRYKDINIYDISILTSYETMFGTCFIYKIILNTNDVLIWKSSKWIENLDKAKNITFTVKSHTEFKGVKQTEVTRCNVI